MILRVKEKLDYLGFKTNVIRSGYKNYNFCFGITCDGCSLFEPDVIKDSCMSISKCMNFEFKKSSIFINE